MNTHTPKHPKIRQSTRLSPARTARATLTALASLALLITACGDADDDSTPLVQSKEVALLPAPDCDTVRERVIDTATEQVLRQLRWSDSTNAWRYNDTVSGEHIIYPVDYAEPNGQEVDDDKPDVFKTDGQYIYTTNTNNNQLLILQSSSAGQTTIVGRHPLGYSNVGSSLLLKDHRVIIFSVPYGNDVNPITHGKDRDFNGTRVTIFDVSDRTAPKVEQQFDIEGSLKSTRLLDNKVYLVTKSDVNLPFNLRYWLTDNISSLPTIEWATDTKLLEQRRNHARTIVRERIAQEFADLDVQSILPRIRTRDADGNIRVTSPLYECTDFYLPQQIANLGLRNISSFDLEQSTNNQPPKIQSTGLFANGWTMYATQQNLYFGMSNRSWWWGFTAPKNETYIHKFELKSDTTKPAYTANGKLDGWLIDTFSMSEHDNHLRVATTDNHLGRADSDGSAHRLTVLKQTDNRLQQTGPLHDLAPGKPIYAARRIGNQDYLVSSEPTDPLYTFDLSDPATPKALGQLAINAYIHAIHPVGDHSLLIISTDSDVQNTVKTLQLQIFDVSAPQKPTRTHQHAILTAGKFKDLSLPSGFTYDAKREILAVPVHTYEEDDFSGLVLLKVTAQNGFQEIGRINHADIVLQAHCSNQDPELPCEPRQNRSLSTNIHRSFFTIVDNQHYVYSFSTFGLKINDLSNLQNERSAFTLY